MTIAEFRKLRKRAGVCRDCGKEDAYTMGGRTYCYECAEKGRLAKQKARADPTKNKVMLDQHKKMRDSRKEKGLCPDCGKPVENGKKRCTRCSSKQKLSSHNYKTRIGPDINYPRGDNGICWQCNKVPSLPDKKLCLNCYEVKVSICKSLAETGRNKANCPWKNQLKAKAV